MAKLKFKKGYSDVGVFPLLSHVLREGVLIVDDEDFDLNTSTSLTGEEKVKILQNGKAVLTTSQDIADLAAGGGGSPAGSDTQIQYNNAGAFGADSGFTRTSTGVTNITSTFGTDTFGYQISDDILGLGGLVGSVNTWTTTGGDFGLSGLTNLGGNFGSHNLLQWSDGAFATSELSRDKVVLGFNDTGNGFDLSGGLNIFSIRSFNGSGGSYGINNNGSTVRIGNLAGGNNTKITIDDVNEHITISNLPAYDDDTAAGVAGLTAGMVYMTTGSGSAPLNAAGILMIKQ